MTVNNQVEYYDSDSGSVIDVTNIVSPPPTGDFGNQQRPDHRFPQFDDQGLFVFYDARAEEFNFFDTDSKKVTRTSKDYLPAIYQVLAKDPHDVPVGGAPGESNTRICPSWLWVVDDTRYLREVHEDNNHYLVLDTMPARGGGDPDCADTAGQRITPPSTEISTAVADRAGSTILFTVFSQNDIKVWNLYRVNPKDPSHPTQVKMSGDILEHAGYDGGQVMSFIGWL